MEVIGRRAALLGVGIGAAAALSVASAMLRRKPPDVVTPLGPPDVMMQPLSALVATEPPAAIADVAILDAEGTPHHLADFAGRAVVLNLWATWCLPCVSELPALAALARRLPPAEVAVLAVASDRGGAAVVRQFYQAHAIEGLDIWLDPKGDAGRAWGARGIPTTLILDPRGLERGRLEGATDWASDAAVARIRALLG